VELGAARAEQTLILIVARSPDGRPSLPALLWSATAILPRSELRSVGLFPFSRHARRVRERYNDVLLRCTTAHALAHNAHSHGRSSSSSCSLAKAWKRSVRTLHLARRGRRARTHPRDVDLQREQCHSWTGILHRSRARGRPIMQLGARAGGRPMLAEGACTPEAHMLGTRFLTRRRVAPTKRAASRVAVSLTLCRPVRRAVCDGRAPLLNGSQRLTPVMPPTSRRPISALSLRPICHPSRPAKPSSPSVRSRPAKAEPRSPARCRLPQRPQRHPWSPPSCRPL
jgi:hypothetical protein